jgi:hypothetical protein
MFKLVTWIVGFAAVVLGFAVKEGFGPGLEKIAHPRMLFILGCVGLAVIINAYVIVRDHGRHINRTFARADAARDGESAPLKIWQAGKNVEGDPLPPICRQLLYVVCAFGLVFLVLTFLGACAWLAQITGQPPR